MGFLVPDDASDLVKLREGLYLPAVDVTEAKGSILIAKLPGGPLKFLHKLFVPHAGAEKEVERIMGFPPPPSYAAFLTFSDGAILFDNTLFLYGVCGIKNHSVSIENIRPISLEEQVNFQRMTIPALDWIEIGSLAAATETYSLQINSLGCTSLCNKEGERRECGRFLSMLLLLVQILNQHSGRHGLYDPTAETLQQEMKRFIADLRQ
jgi:hypothetical protein